MFLCSPGITLDLICLYIAQKQMFKCFDCSGARMQFFDRQRFHKQPTFLSKHRFNVTRHLQIDEYKQTIKDFFTSTFILGTHNWARIGPSADLKYFPLTAKTRTLQNGQIDNYSHSLSVWKFCIIDPNKATIISRGFIRAKSWNFLVTLLTCTFYLS